LLKKITYLELRPSSSHKIN